MKKSIRALVLFAVSLVFVSTACNKEKGTFYEEVDNEASILKEDVALDGKGRFEKVVINPLVKLDDCRFIVSGTIEYRLDGEVVAVVDYGDGRCDNIATKTVRGNTTMFELDAEKGKPGYEKVVVEPLVRIEDCDYIVSGIIKFYKDRKWVASIDFGDGECDDLAVKYWDGGRKEFRLK